MRTKCDCGQPLKTYCGRGQRPRWCSRSCRDAAYYRRSRYGTPNH
ncbi:hypothetical protein [Streptomyces sp. AV19]|nr:hypothetical protein [Streptomyces sp. AV19]